MMCTKQPKKLTIMNILDILKSYTDENHRLSQKEIQEILEREYDMKLDRKAVKRNLMNLIEFGYDVNYSESVRVFRAVFRAEKFILSDIIDMFGKDVKFSDESEKQITVTADVNEQAMEQFAKAYTPYVEIIKPVSLRERMIHNLSAGIKQYNVKGSGVN